MRQMIALRTIFLMLLLLSLPGMVFGQSGEGMGYTSYYFNDSGGNSVSTTSFNLAKKILEKTVFLLDLEVDNVHVPPITAVTGATRPARQSSKPFEKTRGQAIVGFEQGLDGNTSLALNLYRSQEVDYTSNSAIVTFTKELFQRNTTLSLRGQYIMDQVGKLLDSGQLFNRDKNSIWAVGRISQVLSPTTVMDISYDALYHQGFLSDPYRTVQVFDQNNAYTSTEERHPDTRLRHAVSGRVSKMLPEVGASLIGRYRYYFDSWQVNSHTFEVQFNKYVFNDVIAKFDYRFYAQEGADFFRERYAGSEYLGDALRTADYKLSSFDSNNFGFSLSYLFRGLANKHQDLQFLENTSIEGRYFRYFNTLDFSANIFQLNINFGL